jgi:hypothetical protein
VPHQGADAGIGQTQVVNVSQALKVTVPLQVASDLNDWRAEKARKTSLSDANAPLDVPTELAASAGLTEYRVNTVTPPSTAIL